MNLVQISIKFKPKLMEKIKEVKEKYHFNTTSQAIIFLISKGLNHEGITVEDNN